MKIFESIEKLINKPKTPNLIYMYRYIRFFIIL